LNLWIESCEYLIFGKGSYETFINQGKNIFNNLKLLQKPCLEILNNKNKLECIQIKTHVTYMFFYLMSIYWITHVVNNICVI